MFSICCGRELGDQWLNSVLKLSMSVTLNATKVSLMSRCLNITAPSFQDQLPPCNRFWWAVFAPNETVPLKEQHLMSAGTRNDLLPDVPGRVDSATWLCRRIIASRSAETEMKLDRLWGRKLKVEGRLCERISSAFSFGPSSTLSSLPLPLRTFSHHIPHPPSFFVMRMFLPRVSLVLKPAAELNSH